MKKFFEGKRKFIFAAIALILIVGILTIDLATKTVEVEAKQNIFQPMVDYTSGITVLEIVPSADQAEIGYFIPNDERVNNGDDGEPGKGYRSLSKASLGTRYGEDDNTNTDNHVRMLVEMRKYGMIKYLGLDAPDANGISENPIRTDRWATFVYETTQGDYVDLPATSADLVDGHYELSAGGATNYKLNDGYVLGDGTVSDVVKYRSADGKQFLDKLEARYFYQRVQFEKDDVVISVSDNTLTEVIGDGKGEDPNNEPIYGYKKIEATSGIPVAVTPVNGTGDLKFVYVVNQDDIYQGYSATQHKYLANRDPDDGWFINGNWFREYILGGDDTAINANVDYRIMTANEVNVSDIEAADLVYISGTSQQYKTAGQDLKPEVVQALYNRTTQGYLDTDSSTNLQVTKYQAIMMDYLSFSGEATTNIDKLAMLTWREAQTAVPKLHTGFNETTGEMTDATGALGDATLFTELKSGMYVGHNGNFAVNNIYVYDHHWGDFQDSQLKYEQVDARDNFANGDLKSAYTAAATSKGFSSVLSYIKINNNNTQIGQVAEGIVTPALAIQYILSYRGEDLGVIKSQYSVLEIQPTNQFRFNRYNESVAYGLSPQAAQLARDEFIENVFGEEMTKGGRQEYITFTSMTIDEFNTRQDDLLSDYDIIYIGDEWSANYYHKKGGTYAVASQQIVSNTDIPAQYNEASMDGMIYYNLGDEETTNELRYSSRDLTEAKLKELKYYLDNDALIIVGEELMAPVGGATKINPTAVNGDKTCDHGRVDTSSNLYELLAYGRGRAYDPATATYSNTVSGAGIGVKGNLVSEFELATLPETRKSITSYLGRSRLQLNMQEMPSQYSYMTDTNGAAANATYLEKESDGKYYLRYEFSIANSEVDAALGQTYSIHFFEDVNADGRFGESEEKTDIEIRDLSNGSEAFSTTVDGVTTYNLYAGVSYELTRQVPSDEGGIINWCIKVAKTTDSNVHTQATGYTAIKPMNRRVLNILQITDADDSAINLEQVDDQSDLGKYLYAPVVLEQYEINVRTITTQQFEKDLLAYTKVNPVENFSTVDACYLNYFNKFQRSETDIFPATITALEEDPMNINMVILGFGDTMEELDATSAGAIQAYIESGKPVLTSNSVVKEDVNTDLASITGVDRYGYYSALYAKLDKTVVHTKGEAGYTAYAVRRELAGNAIGYVVGSGRGTMNQMPKAITNTIIRSKYRADLGTPTYYNSVTTNSYYVKNSEHNQEFMYIDKMNEGQITNFPYVIADHTLIRLSHAQDLQLDLDTDADNDNHSDAIAWFTLSATSAQDQSFADARASVGGGTGNIYVETPGDGINNYYIYNYGNVTYMGLGGYGSSVTAGEAQLFVNTLLAAYEAGYSDPIVNYYETPDVNDGKLDSIAVPYDGNITGQNQIDSSIIYDDETRDYMYKFVNPNTATGIDTDIATKAYFKITDSNFVRGEKVADVVFYLGVNAEKGTTYTVKDGRKTMTSVVEEITLNDNSVVTVIQIPIDIYNATFEEKIGRSDRASIAAGTNPQLKVGTMYGFYAPMSYIKEMGAAKIYIQANTGYLSIDDTGKDIVRPLGTAYDMFTIIKQDLLKLD